MREERRINGESDIRTFSNDNLDSVLLGDEPSEISESVIYSQEKLTIGLGIGSIPMEERLPILGADFGSG